jgi:hypothetical protein
MKIITSNREIVYSSANGESFSYFPDNPTNNSGGTAQQMMADPTIGATTSNKKFDWSKAKDNAATFGTFLKDSGIADLGKQVLINKFGGQKPPKGGQKPPTGGLQPEKTTQVTIDENKPMSTGVKVAIGLGIATVLGLIIYKATRK